MTLLHEDVESKKYDVRVVERNVARGAISAADVDKNTQKLPDDAENADWVTLESLTDQDSSKGSTPIQH
ncbi:MAG TPA: hypothetical protein DCS07_17030 [Bdellovibrionales bacterium]|nr:MAG: hypothetical protein A2Z97_04250 [Bdellovibrionales bacterium GWB1_52_6]OFZ03670.1 MAG: hypothetical protein A2X97_01090 [Bdellovibrionales bacterium GWA1_52_35]OFZ42549.1 MAG: hypothetical protein A2070_12560 [Bdellovibrionales bacterium GWC1_52_8]HAR44306.1 hypothetical protein [Bdellovibrionales bacterium]HCM40603.1 hypothetical protein [Bdellovibrionales bacterium]